MNTTQQQNFAKPSQLHHVGMIPNVSGTGPRLQSEHNRMPVALQNQIHAAGGHSKPMDWNQAGEHKSMKTRPVFIKEDSSSSYELHKELAADPNLPITERLKHGAQAASEAITDSFSKITSPDTKWVDTPAEHHLKAREADANYEIRKQQLSDPNLPLTERIKTGAELAGAAIEGGYHRIAENVMVSAETGSGPTLNEEVHNKANEVAEHAKVQEADASYELHKNQAINPNLPVAERLTAGAKLIEDTVACGFHRAAEAFYKM